MCTHCTVQRVFFFVGARAHCYFIWVAYSIESKSKSKTNKTKTQKEKRQRVLGAGIHKMWRPFEMFSMRAKSIRWLFPSLLLSYSIQVWKHLWSTHCIIHITTLCKRKSSILGIFGAAQAHKRNFNSTLQRRRCVWMYFKEMNSYLIIHIEIL